MGPARARRSAVSDAMRADTTGLNVQSGRRPNQTGEPDTMPSENTVHIAIELSFSSWLVAARLTGAKKSRLHRIEGGDTGALLALIAELQGCCRRHHGLRRGARLIARA